MKVEFSITGGFAGLTRTAKINADKLSKEESDLLHSLIEQSAFFDMPDPGLEPMPDMEVCNLTIETKGKKRTIRTALTSVSGRIKPLIKYLTKKSQIQSSK